MDFFFSSFYFIVTFTLALNEAVLEQLEKENFFDTQDSVFSPEHQKSAVSGP